MASSQNLIAFLAIAGWIAAVLALAGWSLQTRRANWWRDRAYEELWREKP